MKLTPAFAASLLFAATACSALTSSEPVVCTDEYRYGLQVFVRDSVTNAAAASGAQLITVDQKGKRDTSGMAMGDLVLLGAGEHAGTFTVTVRKAGYHDWVRSHVVVTADRCHVNTTSLTALLQPSS